MSQAFGEVASCAPSQKGDSYIYAIAPTTSDGLAAITSADELLLVDAQSLESANVIHFPDVPTGLTCMVTADQEATSIICAARDGTTATYDVRSQKRSSHFKQDNPITALACLGFDIAVGVELANQQAVVNIWDKRQNKPRWESTENNDDITDLHFHPSLHTRLLSGGDDGLVSIFDTTVAEKEDSLVQVINHGPIHKAGFLSDKIVYAVSSDQHLSLYPVSSDDDSNDPEPVVFGDLRERLECEYAIDMSPKALEGYLAVGSHSFNPRVELRSVKEGRLSATPEITLVGAHGPEVVRSLFADTEIGAIFSAGEDGRIKAFRVSVEDQKIATDAKTKKPSKSTDTRYRPY